MINTLYFGDNLHVLREYVRGESVDLIYLDPPFNSSASYNVLFTTPQGRHSEAQSSAFEDTWTWGIEAETAYDAVLNSGTATAGILRSLRQILQSSDMMAYLSMRAIRLIEMRRVLTADGSLYLHCDATAAHYLKIVLDGIFGVSSFRSEITWKRTTSHGNVSRNYGAVADHLLFYTRSDEYTWNQAYSPFSNEYVESKFRGIDPGGRRWQSVTLRNPSPRPNLRYPFPASNGKTYQPHANGWSCDIERMRKYDREGRLHFPAKVGGQLRLKMYLDESPGVKVQNIWDDIPAVNSQAQERIGYPTQKPLALLERIVQVSSNPGDVVLDPFCGCGTAIHAAEKLGRKWIGIDVTHVAIQIIQDRIRNHLPQCKFEIVGRPKDLEGAEALFVHDPYQFQWWATWLVGGQPRGEKKKGADRGVDGELYFKMGANEDGYAVISVKGGKHLSPAMVSELCAVREREGADVGLFICLGKPTKEMKANAAAAGLIDGQYARVQILTIEELLEGKRPRLPPVYDTITAARAARRGQRQTRSDLTPTELRREPQMTFVIAPGSKRRPQPNLPLDEPLLTSQRNPANRGTYRFPATSPLSEAAEDPAAFRGKRRVGKTRRQR